MVNWRIGEWVWSNYRNSDTVWARPNVDARLPGIQTFCENQFFEIRVPTFFHQNLKIKFVYDYYT